MTSRTVKSSGKTGGVSKAAVKKAIKEVVKITATQRHYTDETLEKRVESWLTHMDGSCLEGEIWELEDAHILIDQLYQKLKEEKCR